MADFAAILRKNIEKLGDTTPEVRAKIYGKAREVLERKIAAIEPAPSQTVRDRQFEKLAQAVTEVEAEHAVPKDIDEQAVSVDAPMVEAEEEPPQVAVPVDEVSTPADVVDTAGPSQTPASDEEDPLKTFLEENVDMPSMPEAAILGAPQAPDEHRFGADDDASDAVPAPYMTDTPIAKTKQSGPSWRRLGVLIVILALLGGVGYFASMAPQVRSALGLTMEPQTEDEPALPVREVETAAVDAEESKPDVGTLEDSEVEVTVEGAGSETIVVGTNPEVTSKFTQRLTPDGVEIDEGPAPGSGSVGEGTSVSDLTPGTETEAGTSDNLEGGQLTEGEESENRTPLRVGQRAIFYEERTGTEAGTAAPGSVIWTQVQESPGGDLPLEPAIRGEVNVPDLDLNLEITIRRNGDKTLPASHFFELSFDLPETFSGRGIADVQRVTFKGSEEDPGTALIGVFVPIDTNFFLVGLNDSAEATQSNTALMLQEDWIDVPIQYVSGRRALVTIEKGTPGDRVFDQVFEYWETNPLPVEG